jgi:hypothetical protein
VDRKDQNEIHQTIFSEGYHWQVSSKCWGVLGIINEDGKKVKLSLYFNWAPRHEGVLGVWIYSSTHSLTSALDGGERSASRAGRFTPRERVPGTHWIEGWVGPWTVLEGVMKRKISSPRRESKTRTPIVQPVARRYTDWAITTDHTRKLSQLWVNFMNFVQGTYEKDYECCKTFLLFDAANFIGTSYRTEEILGRNYITSI